MTTAPGRSHRCNALALHAKPAPKMGRTTRTMPRTPEASPSQRLHFQGRTHMAIQSPIARMRIHARRLALVLVALLGSAAHASRSSEDADSPIGPQRFFQKDRMTRASISPDGQTVVITAATSDTDRVRLLALDLKTMKFKTLAGMSDSDVNSFHWVNGRRLVFDLCDRQVPVGYIDAAPGLYSINVDGTGMRQLIRQHNEGAFQNRADDIHVLPWNTDFLQASGDLTGDDIFLVKTEEYDEQHVDFQQLQRFDTARLALSEIPTPTHSFDWVFDRKGELRVVVTRKDNHEKILARDPATNEWSELGDFDRFFDGFSPSYIDENGTLYVEANNGGDKTAVWTYDLTHRKMGDKPFLVSDHYDLDPEYLTVQGKLAGLRFDADARVTQWISPDIKALQARIDKMLPSTDNEMDVAAHGDGHFVVVRAFSDTVPGIFFLYDTRQDKLIKLGETQPDINPARMAAMKPVRYAARDGLDIPAYLTIPRGAEPKNLPLVLMVHGGPQARGRVWGWDAEVQFLAAHGYAVLEPEFRGSTGYGSKLFTAGWKQWGLAMQDDLADGVKWAVAQGIVDPRRVCIAGASYGGYAALMGLVNDPDVYRCAIDWVGVTDLNLMFSADWSDFSDTWKKFGLVKLLGDPKADAQRLRATSPDANVNKIHAPVLMAYGGKDRRVPIEHGERFHDALMKQPGANVEWVVYKDEGHGWRALETQVDFWNRVSRFLDANIGPDASTRK